MMILFIKIIDALKAAVGAMFRASIKNNFQKYFLSGKKMMRRWRKKINVINNLIFASLTKMTEDFQYWTSAFL